MSNEPSRERAPYTVDDLIAKLRSFNWNVGTICQTHIDSMGSSMFTIEAWSYENKTKLTESVTFCGSTVLEPLETLWYMVVQRERRRADGPGGE